ncbi:MAG: alpha/beta hydrolase [Gemmatimonadota bacterium]|nr:alpha/beta hydrolase [Gemmatimonadota bacterium]
MLPGWGGSAYLFSRNLSVLAAAGLRAIAIDPIGLGGSEKPRDAKHYTLDAQCRYALETFDAIGLRSASLVGQSFGARIALEMALRVPARIDRLMLIGGVGLGSVAFDPMLSLFTALTPLAVAPSMLQPWVFRFVVDLVTGSEYVVTDEDVAQFFAPAFDPAFGAALYFLLEQMERKALSVDRLRQLTMPVRAIHGGRDRLVRIGTRAREWMGDRLLTIPGAGHLTNFEVPALVNPILTEFFSRGEMA